MKTLANCKPSEFLVQTNKIRKSVSRWLTDTDIMNIRRRMPEFETVKETATDEEKIAVIQRNAEKQRKQSLENGNAVLEAILETHPEETLEVLALLCFVDPAHVDDYPMTDYLNAFRELISNEAVVSFFTSLAQWEQMNISGSARA